MQISDRGVRFVERHEGFVKRAYRDPVGIWTIGTGFTSRSKTTLRYLGKIKPGMTITRTKNAEMLKAAFRDEYGPPIVKGMPGAKQHEFDAGCSLGFNCGSVRAMKWSWARIWRAANKQTTYEERAAGKKLAAAKLRVTARTARGRLLRGLVRRRKEEADLLEYGNYGDGGGHEAVMAKYRMISEAQKLLNKHGFGPIAVDGKDGPRTLAAVLKFQESHPDLTNDGVIGSATLAQLRRRTIAKQDGATSLVVGTGGTAALVVANNYFGQWVFFGLAALLCCGIAYVVWTNRTEIIHKANQVRRKVVD